MSSDALCIDHGRPWQLFDDGATDGWLVATSACASPTCDAMHLSIAPARREGGIVTTERGARAYASWTPSRGLDAQEVPRQLRDFIARGDEVVRERHRRLIAQRSDSRVAARPAPEWEPGERLAYASVFPGAFNLDASTGRGGVRTVLDFYCVDPWCPCEEVTLLVLDADRERELTVDLARWRLAKESRRDGAALLRSLDRATWEPLLRTRRDEMREAGAYVIASYFEAARARAAPARRAPSSDAGGYLRGGEIPAAWVARLFEAARALAPHLLESHLRANVSGAVTFEGDVFLGWDEISLARRGEHHDCLEISLVPRSELDEEHRALRAHHGWALARGRLAPLVYGLTPGEEGPVEREATREEVALALAIAETMAADIPTVLYDDRGGTVCRDVDLDGFSLRVELDVPDVDEASDEHDAGEHDSDEHDPEDDADLDSLDDEYDDEDDEDEDEHEIDWELGVMLRTEAFEDWAIDRGLAPKIASLGTYFAAQLFDYVRNHVDSPTAWADPVTVEGFLLRHAPRKILLGADDEIDRALDGLAAYFEWSRTVRLLDEARARRLDATIRRAAPKYAAAMRDPSCFGLAKGMFHEMRRAGVDVEDQSQIDAYLAEVNRRSREVLVAPIQDAAPANPAPRRWTRAPGEPAPDPKGPCPCGSGKRYKKCCMPR